jgi:hypothetical protein
MALVLIALTPIIELLRRYRIDAHQAFPAHIKLIKLINDD